MRKNESYKLYICCKIFKRLLDTQSPLDYRASYRGFRLFGYANDEAENCPGCGKQFPPELDYFQDYILEKELGFEDTREESINKVWPPEFFSDQWWLTRLDHSKFPQKRLTRYEFLKKISYEDDCLETDQEREALFQKRLKNESEEEKDFGIECCIRLKWDLEEGQDCLDHPNKGCNESAVQYEPEKRRFTLTNVPPKSVLRFRRTKKRYQKIIYQARYCPFCGAKFPKSLAGRWFDIVTKKFGVTNIYSPKELAKIPDKYMSEEWWREAGL